MGGRERRNNGRVRCPSISRSSLGNRSFSPVRTAMMSRRSNNPTNKSSSVSETKRLAHLQGSLCLGLSDGVSGNRQHGFDPHAFAHQLLAECCFYADEDRLGNGSSMRGLIHRSLRSMEKQSIFGSATLCLLSIDKSSHRFRSFNLGDSGFMLVRSHRLIYRSVSQYHRGSAPFQFSSFPKTDFSYLNKTRLYHDKFVSPLSLLRPFIC